MSEHPEREVIKHEASLILIELRRLALKPSSYPSKASLLREWRSCMKLLSPLDVSQILNGHISGQVGQEEKEG